jgi:predicted metal-binding protein
MPYAEVHLIIDPSVRDLCYKSYPGHPKGCPNFGKRSSCPPGCPLVTQIFDWTKPTWVIWNVFDIEKHLKRMGMMHPEWSDRQKQCCLYWQGSARKVLRREIEAFQAEHLGLFVTTCPEAMGVNVTETMWSISHELQWPPKIKAYQVAIAGTQLSSY